MNLFYFNPNGYGEQAFVMAESREKAIEALKATKPDNEGEFAKEYHEQKMNNMANCLDGYTIEEHPVGHVIFTEIS